jgi:DNA-binding beta-propeller fold protein YncE
VAVAPNGKFVYVTENVGDRLAVVNAATGEIVQRFPTDHYPYGVILGGDNHLFVSAWGGTTISDFRVLADGKLAYLGRIEVGRHPSALGISGSQLYVAHAGSDRVAIVDTGYRKVLFSGLRARRSAGRQHAERKRVRRRFQLRHTLRHTWNFGV